MWSRMFPKFYCSTQSWERPTHPGEGQCPKCEGLSKKFKVLNKRWRLEEVPVAVSLFWKSGDLCPFCFHFPRLSFVLAKKRNRKPEKQVSSFPGCFLLRRKSLTEFCIHVPRLQFRRVLLVVVLISQTKPQINKLFCLLSSFQFFTPRLLTAVQTTKNAEGAKFVVFWRW